MWEDFYNQGPSVKKNFEEIKQDYERKKKHFEDEEHNPTYTFARKKIDELIELAEQVYDKLNKDAGVPDNLEIKE